MKKTLFITLSAVLLVSMFVPFLCLGVSADTLQEWEHYVYATDEPMSVDGKKEDSYALGTIFTSDLISDETSTKRSDFTASYIWDGKGKVFCYVEVTDPEIVVNDDLWKLKWWHCDSWQMYIDYGYTKSTNTQWTFVGDGNQKYTQKAPDDWIVKMTATGFNVEFCFDFMGSDFLVGDCFGFGLYYNDCYNYTSVDSYKKDTLKNSSYANPVTSKYAAPGAAIQDCMIISNQKVAGQTGTIASAETTAEPEKTTATPVTTTAVPVTTTAAPVTTKAAPITTVATQTTAEPPATTAAKTESKGCGSSVTVGILFLSAVIPSIMIIRKKH